MMEKLVGERRTLRERVISPRSTQAIKVKMTRNAWRRKTARKKVRMKKSLAMKY